jgi:RNA-binding protein
MATATSLSNKQKQYLKGLAHSLKPVVLLGANGLTEGVMAEIELALDHHELIKVKVPEEDRDLRELIYTTIVSQSGAQRVQVIGKMLILYKPSQAAKITLPRN